MGAKPKTPPGEARGSPKPSSRPPYAGGTTISGAPPSPGSGYAYQSGKRSFVVSHFTRSGRDRVQTLGQIGKLRQAERLARKVFAAVAGGEDPLAERQAHWGAPGEQ